jgi:hypothetical protein
MTPGAREREGGSQEARVCQEPTQKVLWTVQHPGAIEVNARGLLLVEII